ncbi:hypothetical protein [Glacieibacterium sp.]|uniref:hypothetical protein n=1 Tax=Glacieibacterium sp. TaxID=2860237 RepID=UPI003B00D6B3
MARHDPHGLSADYPVFFVGREDNGWHFVCESRGQVAACFAGRDEAIRFARAESDRVPGSVVVVTPPQIDYSPCAGTRIAAGAGMVAAKL